MFSPSYVVTSLSVNGFYQQTTPLIESNSKYLNPQGILAGYYTTGIHYFNVLNRSPTTFSFNDRQHEYRDNKNLHTMMLPPSCRFTTINPRNTITVPHSGRRNTDLKHTLVLSKLSHVIIMYQFTGEGQRDDYYFVLRIKINSVVKKHTATHSGYTKYYGGFGLWQGSLNAGSDTIVVEIHNHGPSLNDLQFWKTRALTIIYCYSTS